MADHLFERLAHLRGRVRYVVGVYGLCMLIVVFFATGMLAGFLDWMWHIDDSGVRLLFLMTVISSSLFVTWRFLYRPLSVPLTDVELAARIESLNPRFEDSLTSTVQFLDSPNDERVGSQQLQAAVIESTLAELNHVEVDSVVETKPVQKLVWCALITCVAVGTIVGFNQAEAATAIHRLVFPFAHAPWPREFELRFVNENLEPLAEGRDGALTAVQGDSLELFVENTRGGLPRDLTFFYRRPDGKVIQDEMRQATLYDDDRKPREIGGANLLISSGPLFFWAKGGDGETQRFQVDVVPPPTIEVLNVHVEPPAYTGDQPRDLPENVANIESHLGTKITFKAQINKPLELVELHRKDETLTNVKLSKDRQTVTGQFTLDHPGVYSWWLALRDSQGFANPDAERYEIRSIPDAVPDIHFEEPKTDVFVTSTATIPFLVNAKDDLKLKDVRLNFASVVPNARNEKALEEKQTRPDNADDLTLQKQPNVSSKVNNALAHPVAKQAGETGVFELATNSNDDHLNLKHEWNLTPHRFPVGTRIELVAEATDYYDLGDPHVGVSNPRTLIVVSKQEKERELADRQEALLLDLERIEKIQSAANDHVRDLKTQIEKAGELRDEDIDLLKRIEMDQRQIESRLTDETDSVSSQARSLKQELKNNGIDNPEVHDLLDTLQGELEFLAEQPLPELQKTLTKTIKRNSSKKDGNEDSDLIKSDLNEAEAKQQQILGTLRDLLSDLSKWRNERNLSADLRNVAGDQGTLLEETKEVAKKTQGKTSGQLTRQDKADLGKLANRQQQLADRVDEFEQQLGQARERIDPSDQDQAQLLSEAEQQMRQSGLKDKMRQAASGLNQNQVLDVVQKQQEAVEELRKLRDILENRETSDTETLVKRLGETQQQMSSLRNEQEQLLQNLKQQNQQSGGKPQTQEQKEKLQKLKRRQEKLRQELNEMVRRLRRLQSPAQQAADRAAQQMEQGEQSLESGDADAAEEEIQESLDDLEQAIRELAEDERDAKEQLAHELMEKIATRLEAMLAQQNGIIVSLKQLDKEREEAGGRWSRRLLRSLKNLAQVQRNLAAETRSAAKDVEVVEVLEMALTGAAAYMDRAANRIDDRDAGKQTEIIQRLAAKRFLDLLGALKEEKNKNQDDNGSDQQGGENQKGQQNQPPGDVVTLIAQLKVMRALQVDLIARVELIEGDKAKNGKLTPDQEAELADIADSQSRLADLARELTSFFGDPDESPPDLGASDESK